MPNGPSCYNHLPNVLQIIVDSLAPATLHEESISMQNPLENPGNCFSIGILGFHSMQAL